VVAIQLGIPGDQAFDRDSGAQFALAMLGFAFAAPAALFSLVVVFHRLRYKCWLPWI
jgi:hypothetical protein